MVDAQGGLVVKSLKHVVPLLVALTLAAGLSGCGKNSTPTGLAPLDQAPPAVPSQIAADLDDVDGAVLAWAPSASANAAGYEVYQYLPCPESENAYSIVATTDAATTQYVLPHPAAQTTLYYRVCTVSSTGVKSPLSSAVAVIVGPRDPGGDDPEGIKIPVRH
jgi:hypothetical protein